jgi:superfamily II DNA or RNA helicase
MNFREEVQKEATETLLKHDSGTANISMRLGKTFVGLRLASHFKKVLVSYPLENIQKGWLSDAEKFNFDISNITFTNHRSFSKYNLEDFDCIILDEVQDFSIANWQHVESQSFKRLYALTATPPNRGEKRQYLSLYCPIRYEVKIDQTTGITNKDYKITVHLLEPSTKRDIKLKSGKYWSEEAKINYFESKYQKESNFKVLLMLIAAIKNSTTKLDYVKKLASSLTNGLIFLETIEQCNQLPYPSVHSKNPDSDNIVELFKQNKIPIITSIGMLKSGVTFPYLNDVIILHCYSSNNKAIQKIGRALNYVEGQIANIHIICLDNTVDVRWVKKGLEDLNQNKITWKKENLK